MPRNDPDHPNAALQFSVEVEGLGVEFFNACDGLMAEYTMTDVEVGGINEYVVKLPGRVKYGTVKLTRFLTKNSPRVAAWFTEFHQKGASRKRQSATITAYDIGGKPICKWVLKEVHPLKWTGPQFTAEGNAAAKETLELAHHGFRQSGLMSLEG